MKKNILFVISGSITSRGGYYTIALAIISHLQKFNNNLGTRLKLYLLELNCESKDMFDNDLNNYGLQNVHIISSNRYPHGHSFFAQLIRQTINSFVVLYYSRKLRIELIFAYSHKSFFVSILSKVLLHLKLIFHWGGDFLDEFILQRKKNNILFRLNFYFRKTLEKVTVKFADRVFCISPEAVNYLKKITLIDKIDFLPNSVDISKFNYSKEEYIKIRKEKNIHNRFVVLYSGSLSTYQCVEEMINFFSILKTYIQNAFFLFCTFGSKEEINKYFIKYNLEPKDYRIKNLALEEVPKYMKSADLGLIFRKPMSLNKVAFPTKFAEYLASGVPILLSGSLVSLAKIVESNKLGIVINSLDKKSYHEVSAILREMDSSLENKKICFEYAKRNYSWHSNVAKVYNALRK